MPHSYEKSTLENISVDKNSLEESDKETEDEFYFDAEEELYYDAPDIFLSSAPASLSQSDPDTAETVFPPLTAAVRHILGKTVFSIQLRIFARMGGLEELYAELRSLAQSHEPVATRLFKLSEMLRKHAHSVPESYRTLLRHATELTSLAISLYQLSARNQDDLFSKMRIFADRAEFFLSLETVRTHLTAPALTRLAFLPEQVRKLASTISLLRFLPQETSFDQWLRIIARQGFLPEEVQTLLSQYSDMSDQLRVLGAEISEISERYPLPAEDDWAGRIVWAREVLNDPATGHHLKTYLPSAVVGTINVSAPLIQLAGRLPVGGSLAQQLSRVMQLVTTPSPELSQLLNQQPFSEFLASLRQQLSDRMVNPALFNALLALSDPTQSLWKKSINITAAFLTGSDLRQAISYALRTGVSAFPGGSLALSAWDWYQTLPADLSWQATMVRFTADLQNTLVAHPQLLRDLLPESVLKSAEALSVFINLPVGRPWQEVLRWASGQMGLGDEYDWLWQRYIELCLVRGIYETLQQGNPDQREALLGELATDLKGYLALRPGSQLTDLLDLLPYLPLLASVREELIALPATDSWVSWATNLLQVVEKHPHPALAGLRQQLEARLVNFLSDSLMAGADALWAQLPEFSDPLRFPEASALPQNRPVETTDWYKKTPVDKQETPRDSGITDKVTDSNRVIDESQKISLPDEQLLDELLDIADKYRSEDNFSEETEGRSAFNQYATGIGLAGGWLATLYLYWRAYRTSEPQQVDESDIEMQELHPHPVSESVQAGSANDALLSQSPEIGTPLKWKKYLLPTVLMSAMSTATAWAAWQQWRTEQKLTLQQVFRELLREQQENQAAAKNQAENNKPVRLKRSNDGRNLSSGRQSHYQETRQIDVSKLSSLFEWWNMSDNKFVLKLVSDFKVELKNKGKEFQSDATIVNEMILFILGRLSSEVQHATGKVKNNSNTNATPSILPDDFIESLIFLENSIEFISRFMPIERIAELIFKTAEYKNINEFFNESILHGISPGSDEVIINKIYRLLRKSKVFGLSNTLHWQNAFNYFFDEPYFLDYSGTYSFRFNRTIEAYTQDVSVSGEESKRSMSITAAREKMLQLLLKKIRVTFSGGLGSYLNNYIVSEAENMLHYVDNKINSQILNPDYSRLFSFFKRNKIEGKFINKLYPILWDKYNKYYLDIINDYVKFQDAENKYIYGAKESLKDLFQDRNKIAAMLIKNFTRPEEGYLQCALFFLITQQINKISDYQNELVEILHYWQMLSAPGVMGVALKDIKTKNFKIDSAIEALKVQAVTRIANKLGKTLTREESLDFYNEIMADSFGEQTELKEEISKYMQVGEYILYSKMNIYAKNLPGIDPDTFAEFGRASLEAAALPYWIAPDHYYDNMTSLKQVQREAKDYTTTDKTFYRLYNDYIKIDAIKEAKSTSTSYFLHNQDLFESYDIIFKKPNELKKYKIRHESQEIVGENPPILKDFNTVLEGDVYILTFTGNEKYIISTLAGYPVINKTDKDIFDPYLINGRFDVHEFMSDVYGDIKENEAINNFLKDLKNKSFVDEMVLHSEKSCFFFNRQQGMLPNTNSINDIIIDYLYSSYKGAAEVLKDKGNITPLRWVLNLIPFFSVINRKINDPEYHPSARDMAWDITDVAVSLGLFAAKIAFQTFKVLKSIFQTTAKAIAASGKSLRGKALYAEIIRLSAPLIVKKIPKLQSILHEIAVFTATTLDPTGPFVFLGTKAWKYGKKSYKAIPRRAKKIAAADNTSFIVSAKRQGPVGDVKRAFGDSPGDIPDDLKYIDEMTGDEILTAKKALPEKFSTDSMLTSLARTPEGQCDKAAERVIGVLSGQGYKTRVIGCLAYKTVSDSAPLTHYAVLASKDDYELIIDVTFEQFVSRMGRKGEALITSWEEWCRKIVSSDKLKNSLIVQKEYKTLSEAKAAIAFTDGRVYLESQYVKDPDFHALLIPDRFTEHLSQLYRKDTELISTPKGMIKISIADKLIKQNIEELKKLQIKESSYINKNKTVPAGLEDEIVKTKRSISELEALELLPNRINNYLYLNQYGIIDNHRQLLSRTPVSSNLENILTRGKKSETGRQEIIGSGDFIESIDERGLVTVTNEKYLMHNEQLYRVHTESSTKTAHINIDGEFIPLSFNKYFWDVNAGMRNIDKTILAELASGSTAPLRNKGLLNAAENMDIDLHFDFIRVDNDVKMTEANAFSYTDLSGVLQGKISTTKGNKLTSRSAAGPVLGKWHQGDISESVDFIKVSNGSSGCVGIKIPLDEVKDGNPVIVSAGQLSGCTMIYATDNKFFYAYHSGQAAGDTGWLTSQQGVAEVYKAHLALKGTTIPSLTNKRLTNQDLPTIFSDYQSATITYLGKNTLQTGDTRIRPETGSDVKAFDYNKYSTGSDQSRLGLAYAVLAKQNNKVNVTTYSEDLAINIKNSDIQALSSQQHKLLEQIPTTEESVFNTSIDVVSDSYTAFLALRTLENKHSEWKDETVTPVSVNINNIQEQNTDNELKLKVGEVFTNVPSINQNNLVATRDNAIYQGPGHNFYMKVGVNFVPFRYYKPGESGYLYCNDKAITVIKGNLKWTTAGILPPVSKANADLSDLVTTMTGSDAYTPFSPSMGDFKRKDGESIYLNKNGYPFMYINNQYFFFVYGLKGGQYQNKKYKARTGMLTVNGQKIRVFREKWLWGTQDF